MSEMSEMSEMWALSKMSEMSALSKMSEMSALSKMSETKKHLSKKMSDVPGCQTSWDVMTSRDVSHPIFFKGCFLVSNISDIFDSADISGIFDSADISDIFDSADNSYIFDSADISRMSLLQDVGTPGCQYSGMSVRQDM